MKIGDLVRLTINSVLNGRIKLTDSGVIIDITEPTPANPYQVVTVLWSNGETASSISRHLEVISETRQASQN